ncbi:MAG TPA: hypothetical protein VJR58_33010 [Vineibacter sp.]|nr:hypothetical protein [Vineibacter sp.]
MRYELATLTMLAVLMGGCTQPQEIVRLNEIERVGEVRLIQAEPAAQARTLAYQLPAAGRSAATPRVTVLRGPDCQIGSQSAARTTLFAVTDQDYANVFQDELRRVGYQALDAVAADARDSRAEFAIAATMTNVRMNICLPAADLGDIYGGKGEASMTVRWQVYASARKSIVYTTTQAGYGKLDDVTDAAARELLRAAFARAVHGLLADEGFRALLRTPPR